MVQEAEEFASEDEAQRKRIEALNNLSSFVYGLKGQLGDQEGLGGKIEDSDKKTLLTTIKETTEWIDENGTTASTEDLEEKLSGGIFSHVDLLYEVLMTLHCRDPKRGHTHHQQVIRWSQRSWCRRRRRSHSRP
jgi:hypothetical protein